MKRILSVPIILFLLTILTTTGTTTSEAKEPEDFVPANVSKTRNIPYPTRLLKSPSDITHLVVALVLQNFSVIYPGSTGEAGLPDGSYPSGRR